jgi:hypothetical protein
MITRFSEQNVLVSMGARPCILQKFQNRDISPFKFIEGQGLGTFLSCLVKFPAKQNIRLSVTEQWRHERSTFTFCRYRRRCIHDKKKRKDYSINEVPAYIFFHFLPNPFLLATDIFLLGFLSSDRVFITSLNLI